MSKVDKKNEVKSSADESAYNETSQWQGGAEEGSSKGRGQGRGRAEGGRNGRSGRGPKEGAGGGSVEGVAA